jgi:small subunit ribosomal protein S20
LANHKSELKRAIQNESKRLRNKAVKTKVKSAVKEVRGSLSENSKEAAVRKLDSVKSVIYKAAKKGVISKKTASRKTSRLAKEINKVG